MDWTLGDWTLGIGMALSAVFAALGGVLILSGAFSRARRASVLEADRADGAGFLFDGETLVDATPDARAILALGPQAGSALARLKAWLAPRFPGVEERLAALPAEGRFLMGGAAGPAPGLLLRGEWRGGLVRLTLSGPGEEGGRLDGLTQHALEQELAALRSALARAPFPIWREDGGGAIVWANATYLRDAAARQGTEGDLVWPLPRLFGPATDPATRRHRLDRGGAGPHWYDLTALDDGEGRLLFALPADAAVQAEMTLREFMQTLTKTFAHLPTGLAIFDRQRRLAVFNPALMDLSGLAPDFLSMRPSLLAFLDGMRDRNTIPEPSDYRGWRRRIAALEAAAAQGQYDETWSLPSGSTYRVTGRPHPNGALALMFEDISTEMSRSRHYRADLELGQAVIDGVEEAIAVFSQAGTLVMSNAAYAALWGHDPSATLGEAGIGAICAHWRGLSAPTPLWAEAEAFVTTLGPRGSFRGEVRLADGRMVACRFRALQGGATLAGFQPALAPLAEGGPAVLRTA